MTNDLTMIALSLVAKTEKCESINSTSVQTHYYYKAATLFTMDSFHFQLLESVE